MSLGYGLDERERERERVWEGERERVDGELIRVGMLQPACIQACSW